MIHEHYDSGTAPRPSRTKVRTVACPECGAAVGHNCIGARGKTRTANHQARVDLYLAAVVLA